MPNGETLLNNNIVFYDDNSGRYYVVDRLLSRTYLKANDYIIQDIDGLHHFTMSAQCFSKLFKDFYEGKGLVTIYEMGVKLNEKSP